MATRPDRIVVPSGYEMSVDQLSLEIAQAVQGHLAKHDFSDPTRKTAALQCAVAEVINRRTAPSKDRYPKGLVRRCPECGSGDVEFCAISVRPYCAECNCWGAVNFGSAADAVREWNKRLGARTCEE